MKILKKGKKKTAEWFFRCEDCGCEFLANENDRKYDRDGDYVKCPTCKGFIDWTLGVEQLNDKNMTHEELYMICHDEAVAYANSEKWKRCTPDQKCHLLGGYLDAMMKMRKEEMRKDNIIIQKCQMSCTFFKLMQKEGKASCTIWLDEAPTICDLYVDESSRRQGYATEMLQMCEDLVKAEGGPGVFLYTDEGSWLVEWYERKGYKKTGETLQIHGQTVTSVWLYKEF